MMKVNSDTKFYHGKGCNECGQSGYTGRSGIYELFRITNKVRELISKKPTTEQLMRAAPVDHVSMMHDGVDKILQGQTTPEEVFRVAKSISEDE
jgi:type II secretory ATPase GspE/PulE/Tfp pilus assembly ATPase PilB-like protein